MKFFFITSILLLSACSMPHIEQDNHKLSIIMHDKSIIHGVGKLIYENRVNLNNLNIEQQVYLMNNNSVLTYEDARVATSYVYSYGMNKTIGLIFPQYQYDIVETKGNMYFFKLSNKNDVLYMILENINKKRIKMVYGLNQKTFQTIYQMLVNDKKILDTSSKDNQSILEDKSIYVKSRWNSKNIILDTIISKVGGHSKLGM